MKGNKLIKSTFILMIVAFISRGIGFIRDILVAKGFGASYLTDVYDASVGIPDTLFIIIGLAISTALLPILSEAYIKKGKEDMHKLANNIINIILIISLAIFILANIFPNVVVEIFAGGFTGEKKELLLSLIPITLFNIFFLGLNACFATILQVHEDFIVPSILGLFFNIPIIGYLIISPEYSIEGLVISNVIGNIFRVICQIPPLLKHGYRYKFFLHIKDTRIKKMCIIILPVLISAGANQLNFIVDKNLASHLGDGDFASLGFAQRLIFFINSIITTSLTNITYPVLANKINLNEYDGFKDILSKGINYLMILLIPISFGVIIFNREIVSIVYKRGEFTEEAVMLTSLAFLGYGVGIFFTGMRDLLNSTLFAMGLTKVTTLNGVIGVIINIILSITSFKILGVLGISISASIAMVVTGCLLLKSIGDKVNGINIKGLFVNFMKIILSSIIMAIIIIIFKSKLTGLNLYIEVIVGSILGMMVYFASCIIFRVKELEFLGQIIKRRG